MISLELLEEMFDDMRSKSKWDVDGDMFWGYFFTDPDPAKLECAIAPLAQIGYRYVDLYETDDGTTYFLHVEKIEMHTPESLHARNAELYQFAEEFDLASYDGMDVGPVKGS